MSSSSPSAATDSARPEKRYRWLLLLVGLGIILGCLLFILPTREPVYQGVKISRFIEMRAPEDIAIAALELGPRQVVPYLISALRAQDSSLKRARLALWKRLPPWYVRKHRSQMPMPAESTRIKLLFTLPLIGPEAAVAIPDLARLALDDSARGRQQWSIFALGNLGTNSPRALEVLLQLLNGTNSAARADAALALVPLGAQARPALPILLREFNRNGPKTPYASLVVLSALGPDAAEAVPVLVDALEDKVLALHAVRVLRHIGPAAADAVPGLARYIEARQPYYQDAVEALLNIGPAARPALPLLKQLTHDTNSVARVLAVVALSRIEKDPASAVPALLREIQEPQRAGPRGFFWDPPFKDQNLSIGVDSRAAATWFLGEIGPEAREAVPVLAARLTNQHSWVRCISAQAIWKINQDTNLALPPLIESLQDTTLGDNSFLLAARFLEQIGPAALPAVPHLIEQRKRIWKRWHATEAALKKIQPSNPDPPGVR